MKEISATTAAIVTPMTKVLRSGLRLALMAVAPLGIGRAAESNATVSAGTQRSGHCVCGFGQTLKTQRTNCGPTVAHNFYLIFFTIVSANFP